MDTYELVTKRILEKMEQGIIPWHKPWTAQGAAVTQTTAEKFAFNRITRRLYSATNQWLLSHAGEYATFAQWTQLGGKIRKGAKSEIVIFWKWLEDVDITEDEDGNEVKKIKRTPCLRYYQVFHISDVDGVQPLQLPEESTETRFDEIAEAEQLLNTYTERERVQIAYHGNEAFYSPTYDSITLPARYKFGEQSAEFYSTAFHEAAHSTGHETRLNRLTSNAHFGNEEYSREELVAEISSASILATLNIETESSLTNSAAYIQGWSEALRNDKRLFVIASAQADKAVNYIFNGKEQKTEGAE